MGLVGLGSQSQLEIRFILPAHGASHIINNGTDQNLVVLVFRQLNCVISKWILIIKWQLNFGLCNSRSVQ